MDVAVSVSRKSGKLSSSKYRRRKRRENRRTPLRLNADSANTNRSPSVRCCGSKKRPRFEGSEPGMTGSAEMGNRQSGSADLKQGLEGGPVELAPLKIIKNEQHSSGDGNQIADKKTKGTAREPPQSGSWTDQQKPSAGTNQRLECKRPRKETGGNRTTQSESTSKKSEKTSKLSIKRSSSRRKNEKKEMSKKRDIKSRCNASVDRKVNDYKRTSSVLAYPNYPCQQLKVPGNERHTASNVISEDLTINRSEQVPSKTKLTEYPQQINKLDSSKTLEQITLKPKTVISTHQMTDPGSKHRSSTCRSSVSYYKELGTSNDKIYSSGSESNRKDRSTEPSLVGTVTVTNGNDAEPDSPQKKKQVTLTQGDFVATVKEVKVPKNAKSDEQNGEHKKQITLTQGDFLETATDELSPIHRNRSGHSSEHPRKESVTLRKPGSIKGLITYSKGDVWTSDDPRYSGFAFALGHITVEKMEHVAEISTLWLKLENTFIGPEQAALVEGCDWVILEEHALMPQDRRIQLKLLCNKLAGEEIPKTALHYREEAPKMMKHRLPSAPTYSYFFTVESQFSPPPTQNSPVALDLFAGGGGMSRGLQQAGWNVKYKVDKDAACCRTLRTNFRKKKVFQMDITQFLRKMKSGTLKFDAEDVILIHGSPPCQGFSGANTSGGNNDWQNKQCTIDFLEVVEHVQPPFVSMENVPGLAMNRRINNAKDANKSYLKHAMGKLISLGYQVSYTMIWASQYGDPQDRKRLILFAAKQGYKLPPSPSPTHGDGDGIDPTVNVHDVLKDLEDLEPNCSGSAELKNGKIVKGHYRWQTVVSSSNDDDTRLYAEHPLAPARTVRKNNKMLHYKHPRYLTLLELKRLFSFPDSHTLEGTWREMRDQIGNAVPCNLAQAIGKTVMESYLVGTQLAQRNTGETDRVNE